MNNPLNRAMFRKKAMAQSGPQGIMASSPELMTAVQRAKAKGKPVRAQTGVSVNTNPRSLSNQQLAQLVQSQIAPQGPAGMSNQELMQFVQGQIADAARPPL